MIGSIQNPSGHRQMVMTKSITALRHRKWLNKLDRQAADDAVIVTDADLGGGICSLPARTRQHGCLHAGRAFPQSEWRTARPVVTMTSVA